MNTVPRAGPPVGWHPGATDVHVWLIPLEATPGVLGACQRVLSPGELERARSFRFDLHRNRFIAGHGRLRMLLGRYLQTDPARLEFARGPNGKPFLSGMPAETWLHFNLAHSENLALLAVTRAGAVGVDVERIRPLSDAGELVARFFSERENAAFSNLPPELKAAAFFNLWTRKEAWLKATGEGIGHLLRVVEVSFLPGEPARFISLPGASPAGAQWVLHHFEPAPGFVAALAACAGTTPPCCHCWDEAITREPTGNPP